MNSVFIDSSIIDDMFQKEGNNEGMNSNSVKFIDFLNKLEGWKTKCKNLHWASLKKSIHTYLDDFLKILSEYQDGLAEEEMGIYGRMLPNVIVGTASMSNTPKDFIYEVRAATLSFYEGLPQDAIHAGIRSECETFIHNINNYIYLFSLCDWEFKSGE